MSHAQIHRLNDQQSQQHNEALIKLTVLLYQIDGIVTLTEQDYFQELVDNMPWHSGISKEAFINDAIHQARAAIDSLKAPDFIRALSDELNIDAAKTLEVAMAITKADGERSEEEVELLALLANRVLAKGLVA
ncbi:TerB family tellurite resistance protein [Glaciecola sp. MH2013]|uniref:TerB family tellurite resistance protein n=1 Tax=Glaciecola sp. MH2013 TaxID=2785524 RepID=UPI00189FB91F|nr:TerB family tellurite resistance protein [Glaciecola sp. MH2013]MBF7074890.1 TerB family tellurite resistance protein [Glaciecola sp. MH2013]